MCVFKNTVARNKLLANEHIEHRCGDITPQRDVKTAHVVKARHRQWRSCSRTCVNLACVGKLFQPSISTKYTTRMANKAWTRTEISVGRIVHVRKEADSGYILILCSQASVHVSAVTDSVRSNGMLIHDFQSLLVLTAAVSRCKKCLLSKKNTGDPT